MGTEGMRLLGLTRGAPSPPNTASSAAVHCSPVTCAASTTGTCTELRGWMIPQGTGLEYHTAAPSLCSCRGQR